MWCGAQMQESLPTKEQTQPSSGITRNDNKDEWSLNDSTETITLQIEKENPRPALIMFTLANTENNAIENFKNLLTFTIKIGENPTNLQDYNDAQVRSISLLYKALSTGHKIIHHTF